MKCDKLQLHRVRGEMFNGEEICGGFAYYDADEVDEAIAELKARIQLDDDEMAGFLDLEEECGGGDLRNYIAELKQKLDEKDMEIESLKASHYAESVDAGMRERKLKRALWLARSEKAKTISKIYSKEAELILLREHYPSGCGFCNIMNNKWRKVERKCRAKAEQYK